MHVLEPALVRLILEHSSAQRVRQLLPTCSQCESGLEWKDAFVAAHRMWQLNVLAAQRDRLEEVIELLKQAGERCDLNMQLEMETTDEEQEEVEEGEDDELARSTCI